MKASELRAKDPAQLSKELTNNSQLKNVRRDIARVRTILKEKAVVK
jgi:ribosomal protein L29